LIFKRRALRLISNFVSDNLEIKTNIYLPDYLSWLSKLILIDLQTVVAGIGHIGELEVVLDLAQFATGEDAHEDLLVGGQFLDVDLGILGHYGELLGEGGQSAIVIQQQDHLIGFGVNEAVERTKLLRSWKLLHG